jgi:chromosome segregation ATPase
VKDQEKELGDLLSEEEKFVDSKPVISDHENDDAAEYEESFASQQETAQLREDIENMNHRFDTIEKQFSLMMKERTNLPDVLNTIRADLNAQLTMLHDKMYSVLEASASKDTVKDVMTQIEEVRADHSDQLKAASGYLSSEPRPESPLVQRGVTLKGKGKFKPVK